RVKLVGMLGLLLAAALIHSIPVLVAFYGATLALAAASRLPLGFFVKRVWLFIPIFTGIVVAPAAFSFITHGRIVVPLGTWFGHAQARSAAVHMAMVPRGYTGEARAR